MNNKQIHIQLLESKIERLQRNIEKLSKIIEIENIQWKTVDCLSAGFRDYFGNIISTEQMINSYENSKRKIEDGYLYVYADAYSLEPNNIVGDVIASRIYRNSLQVKIKPSNTPKAKVFNKHFSSIRVASAYSNTNGMLIDVHFLFVIWDDLL